MTIPPFPGRGAEADRLGDRGVALLLLGMAAFGWPVLAVFDGPGRVGGVPVLYAWLFVAWGALVAALAWASAGPGE